MADLIAKTRHPRRYLLVGLLCALIHNVIIFAGDAAGVHYMIALLISFGILVPVGYALHSFFTFDREMEPIRFLRFAGGMLVGFPLNFALMVLLVSIFKLDVPLATVICTASLFVWNYISSRWAILVSKGRTPKNSA